MRDYWLKCGCDQLPPAVALCTFDAAVNCGPGTALRWVQSAAGVAADGVIGPLTIAAAKAKTAADLLNSIAAQRVLYYIGLPTFAAFGNGWVRRVVSLQLTAAKFDAGSQPVPPAPSSTRLWIAASRAISVRRGAARAPGRLRSGTADLTNLPKLSRFPIFGPGGGA